MKRDREQLLMQKSTLEREYGRYSGRVGSVPQVERVFTEIGRQRDIKQAVYLLLLQKREETAMDLANTTDKGRLIDEVKAVNGSAKPQTKLILIAFFLLGSLLPMGILYLLKLLKTKVDTQEELKALTQLPILAEIPTIDNEEAIYNLRTTLLLNLKPAQKTILVASQNAGDGKTYIAQHLADSLNAIGKKALYINTDLRSNNSKDAHPADILASDEFAKQIAVAKEANDYVILDSPALNKYIDALQLVKFADATLFIAKAGSTVKSDIESLNNDTRIPQPMLVLNNSTQV